jgi:uncharacterized protein (TIGR03546 family)
MTILLKQIFGLIKLLNSDKGTNQIAAGAACGLILGLTPALSLQSLLVFVCLFFFRIQIGAAFLAAFFFAIPAYLFDPLLHQVGVWVLEQPSLRPVFTELYNMPIVPFTRFYNTVVMGSGVVAIACAPLIFILSKILIQKYRDTVVARFGKSKAWHVLKASTFYQWYQRYDQMFG